MGHCWLKAGGLWLLSGLGAIALAAQPVRIDTLIEAAAQRTGIPVGIIDAVIHVESARKKRAVSPKGAQGLMQLMPDTARRFGVTNAFDPAQNIRGGTTYLAWLYQRYMDWPLALAAYNAGEGAVDRYGGIPPYRETQAYVRKVLARYQPAVIQPVIQPVVQPAFHAVIKPPPTEPPMPTEVPAHTPAHVPKPASAAPVQAFVPETKPNNAMEAVYTSPIFFETGQGR